MLNGLPCGIFLEGAKAVVAGQTWQRLDCQGWETQLCKDLNPEVLLPTKGNNFYRKKDKIKNWETNEIILQ